MILLSFCWMPGQAQKRPRLKKSSKVSVERGVVKKTYNSRIERVANGERSYPSVPSLHFSKKSSLPVTSSKSSGKSVGKSSSSGKVSLSGTSSKRTPASILAEQQVFPLGSVPSREFPLRRTFRARPLDPGETHDSFSGTFFKTQYRGREEVYGVVATHTLSEDVDDFSLKRHFVADVYIDGSFMEVPMEIVQLGAPGMLDISLVKIPEEIIPFIEPYTLMPQIQSYTNEPFVSFGFVGDQPKQVTDRYMLRNNSSYSLRTMMPAPLGSYMGGCGGPVEGVSAEGEPLLVGIHTGSSGISNQGGNVGYATQALFLQALVDAYHQNGEAYFPLEILGRHIMDLRVDEYISSITFFDRKGVPVARHRFSEKFSYTAVNRILDEKPVREMEITVGRITWNKKPSNIVQLDTQVRRVRYNLLTEELTPVEDS